MFSRLKKISIVSLFWVSSIHAGQAYYDDCSQPCCSYECPDFFSGLEGGIEVLLWRPCVTNIDYGILADTLPSLSNGNVVTADYKSKQCYGFEPGGRLSLKKRDPWDCDWTYAAYYTYIHPTDAQGFSNSLGGRTYPNLSHPALVVGNPPTVRFNSKIQYHDWELLLQRDYCPTCCQKLSPFFGGEALLTIHRINSDAASDDRSNVEWRGEYWGLGLKLGAEYTYNLLSCLDLYTMFSGKLLGGQSTTRNQQTLGDNSTIWVFKTKGECICVPGWHYKLGLRYQDCICGAQFKLWLGYEFVQWLGLPNPQRFYGQASQVNATVGQATSQTVSALGFHGFQFGAGIGF